MGMLTRRDRTSVEPIAPVTVKGTRSSGWKRIGEITTSWVRSEAWGAFGAFRRSFWPTSPIYTGGTISYALARRIYKNDDKKFNLGATFGKRIVNATVDFMGLPMSSTGDEVIDEFLNNCIHNYWSAKLQEAFRDSLRDSQSIIRIRRHDMTNPLVAADEWESCYLEIVPPETCSIYYATVGDTTLIDTAYIRHEIEQVEERAVDSGATLMQPRVRTHILVEELTADGSRFYDETEGRWRDDLTETSSFNFVPLLEMFNEYDSTVKGGQSEYDNCLPFIMAFHDVVSQSLLAHKAHSIPKATFKVNDMMSFIAANWPDSFDRDESGQPDFSTFNGNISWKGTEMFFMQAEESVDFLQVQSALGDSKTLLDFLLTCLVIASETPRSVLMDQQTTDADEMIPFAHKIRRKRNYFGDPIQTLCKMVLAINHMEPTRVPLAWDEITPSIALQKAQALQQDVMSLEVLATREVVSDGTIRRTLRSSIPAMKSGTQEAADAKKNVVPAPPPSSGSQGASGAPTSTGAVKGSDSGNQKVAGNQN